MVETLKDKLKQNQRVALAAWIGLFFLIFSAPFLYRMTTKLGLGDTADTSGRCPTDKGIALHALVVAAVAFLLISGGWLPIGEN